MAPVTATTTGVLCQLIDDPKLVSLLDVLCSYDKIGDSHSLPSEINGSLLIPDVDIEGLVGELERIQQWRFDEQADLYQWIKPLNAIDAALRKLMKDFPALLLISQCRKLKDENVTEETQEQNQHLSKLYAESEAEANLVPSSIIHAILTILRFLAVLLRNSYNKSIFNSLQEITDLLAAEDDDIASQALEVLSSLAVPARMTTPEMAQNSTVLHNSTSSPSHSRLMMLAKGLGSRGSGLGLGITVTADDSFSGQGTLPQYAGQLFFDFLPPSSSKATKIHLSSTDICVSHVATNKSANLALDRQVEKKRKTTNTSIPGGVASSQTKSTSHLFFQALDQIGGRNNISTERLFDLLVHIRLAKSFHSRAARIAGVEQRLRALLTVLCTHPSQDILAGYFHAQPELCSELTDLVRPTVSPSAVSSSGSVGHTKSITLGGMEFADDEDGNENEKKQAVIKSIVESSTSAIPYAVRTLTVEVLTALVGRKDDGSNGVTHVARQANVLAELGVAKGQFLGLLPTLIRYSLASFKLLTSNDKIRGDSETLKTVEENNKQSHEAIEDVEMKNDLGLELGMAFINATKPVMTLDKTESEEKALEFISCVLCLAYSVINLSSGTSALTEGGLIPALVSTIVLEDPYSTLVQKGRSNTTDTYTSILFKSIVSQSIQLLEGAITNNNQALSAFHELKGVDLMVSNICSLQQSITKVDGTDGKDIDNNIPKCHMHLQGSTRILIYQLLHCLMVVFHLQETSSRSATFSTTQGTVLRKKEMTDVLIDIMDNTSSYRGVLTSLAITFLCDTMNSDPRIVHYVYECGLADSIFRMIKSCCSNCTSSSQNEICDVDTKNGWHEPTIPASPELVMALPNVLTALALTEDGRNKLSEVNPTPELLGILCSPKFAMPNSRCMLGDMASMIGNALDEFMRHVPSLKSMVIESTVTLIKRVNFIGKELVKEELDLDMRSNGIGRCEIEDSRIRFMQYSHNLTQILEQILQNEEHCAPFVNAGGVEVLLDLHPLLMPSGKQLLAHISCQSSPSVAILTHSTISLGLTAAIKRATSNDNSAKVLKKVIAGLERCMIDLENNILDLRNNTEASPKSDNSDGNHDTNVLNISGILEGLPRVPLHSLQSETCNLPMLRSLSCFLRDIVNIEWISVLLSVVVKISCSSDIGSRGRLEWLKELSTEDFQLLSTKLSTLYQSSLFEVCRIRTEDDYDTRDNTRWGAPGDSSYHPAVYRLRIVCAEGAVVRDGIDIDSCASVGGLEMGEEVDAYDRCINGSGIMRYRTAKGWVSEQTRGHAREPILEVIEVRGVAKKRTQPLSKDPKTKKAIECGIPDICSASAAVLSRLQNSQSNLYSCLSRAVIVGFKYLSTRSLSEQQESIFSRVGLLSRAVATFLRSNFDFVHSEAQVKGRIPSLAEDGVAMYQGNVLNLMHSCIYEERRDKQILNVFVFCNLLVHDGLEEAMFIPESSGNAMEIEHDKMSNLPSTGFYGAIRTVFRHSLCTMAKFFENDKNSASNIDSKRKVSQRLNKSVASSFPSALSLLRLLTSQSLLIDTQVSNYLNKMKRKDFEDLVVGDNEDIACLLSNRIFSFRQEAFANALHCTIASIALEFWTDRNMKCVPSHVLNPILSFMRELLVSLESSIKHIGREENGEPAARSLINQMSLWPSRQSPNATVGTEGARVSGNNINNDVQPPAFEASESSIARLMEMGFTRERALDAIESSRSNTVEIAMEYALSHPLISPTSVRQAARQARQRVPFTSRSAVQDDVAGSGNEAGQSLDDGQGNQDEANGSGDVLNPVSFQVNEEGSVKAEDRKLSEAERKALAEKDLDAKTLSLVKERLQLLRESIMEHALNLIEGPPKSDFDYSISTTLEKNLNDESEICTVVTSSFLLELCDRYPEERPKMVDHLLCRLQSHLTVDSKGSQHTIIEGRERYFASTCHASVIFLRALPRLRLLVLKKNLVSCLLQAIRGFSSKLRHMRILDQAMWPCWLTPSLLLLDIIAQPMVLPKDEETSSELKDSLSRRGDYSRVCAEHKKQQVALTKTSKRISLAIGKVNGSTKKAKQKDSRINEAEKKKNDYTGPKADLTEVNRKSCVETSNEQRNPLSDFPIFLPLLTHDMAESCLAICLQLLRVQQKRSESNDTSSFFIPSKVTHAMLLLLTKILRSQKIASQCLRMGGAELLLSIQRESRFNGHVCMLTLALRRMIEEEATLQTVMESEIRSTVAKILKKESRGTEQGNQSISSRSFVKSVSHLICRDPAVFLKAAAVSVRTIPCSNNDTSGQLRIAVFSSEERAKNAKALIDCFRNSTNQAQASHVTCNSSKVATTTLSSSKKNRNMKLKPSIIKQQKVKSPQRSVKKSQKKDKQEKFISLVGTPSNHVISHLLSHLLKSWLSSYNKKITWPFLCTFEYLEIIGDLVLAVPVSAAAVHGYQLSNDSISIRHALQGYQAPHQNIVNFLLHDILSRPRAISSSDIEKDPTSSNANGVVKRETLMIMKTSQFAARLLVALVARSGEGRTCVISELTHALKGERCTLSQIDSSNEDKEMWALQSWGELCIGLAAPRSVNSTHDTDSSLSYEVVKLMLERGMAHALMAGINRIDLYHPLAATTAAALLRPLEIFTRPGVVDALLLMTEKSEKKMKTTLIDNSGKAEPLLTSDQRESQSANDATSQRNETSFADDSMLGDGFDVDESNSNLPWLYNRDDSDSSMQDAVEDSDDDEDDMDMERGFEVVEEDSDMMSEDESEEDDDDSSSSDDSESDDTDDLISSGNQSEGVDGEEGDEDDHNDDIALEEDAGEDEDNQIGDQEIQLDEGEGDTDDYFFERNDDGEDNDVDEDNLPADGDFDGEGWTSIEAGLESMMFGSRNNPGAGSRTRTGGSFMLEAAETVIGNILRSGGLHIDALAEIEDTLGIRISNRPGEQIQSRFARLRASGDTPTSNRNRSIITNDSLGSQNRIPIGATPTVNQRNLSENMFSSMGNGRNGERNFMEYLYGGPPLGSDRVFYDLSGSGIEEESASDVTQSLILPSTLDVQLFPGGSAASTHSRPPSVLHPLLSAITLPPLNALVSVPTRSDDGFRESRVPGNSTDNGWTEVLTSSRGNIVRLSRGPGTGMYGRSVTRDLNGWTDDGVPNGINTNEFSLSFERALTNTISNSISTQVHNEATNSETVNQNHHGQPETGSSVYNHAESNDVRQQDEQALSHESEISSEPTGSNPETSNGNASDGDNVVSSLAESFTLSARNPLNGSTEDSMPTNETINPTSNETNNLPIEPASHGVGDIGGSQEVHSGDTNRNETSVAEAESNDVEPNALQCPTGMDIEVFNQLPIEMQQEIIEQYQATTDVAAQLDATSGLDPEALAALPEDVRREVIEQEQNERRLREQEESRADPSNAEEMDNASFIASLAPDLRQEILLQAEDAFLNSLPPDIVAEAQLLRERAASSRNRRDIILPERSDNSRRERSNPSGENGGTRSSTKKKNRTGKVRVESDRAFVTFTPAHCEQKLGPLVTSTSIKSLISLMYLLSPVRPQRLLQKLFQNLCYNPEIRATLVMAFISLLNDEPALTVSILESIGFSSDTKPSTSQASKGFPPSHLLGTAPDIVDTESTNDSLTFFRRRHGSSTAAAIASTLPLGARCSVTEGSIPTVVARRLVGALSFLSKNTGRTALDILYNFNKGSIHVTYLDKLLGLLGKSTYSQSASNLEDLLNLIESICVLLSSIAGGNDNEIEVSKKDLDAAADAGKEWIGVPRAVISPQRLRLLCSTLKLESCKDAIFVKVNNIARRLCKVEANRKCIMRELASVAQCLGTDAIHDLRALRIRLNDAVQVHYDQLNENREDITNGIPSSAVTLSTSSSELKLLRVLQTLLSVDDSAKKSDGNLLVREELVSLLKTINLDPVWEQLTSCLRIVSILEGVSTEEDEKESNQEVDENEENNESSKKLQNSVAGLLTRFLPTIEAFFLVNASATEPSLNNQQEVDERNDGIEKLVGGYQLIDFVATNKVLINALLRSIPSLLEKGFRAMVRVPRCRQFLDFDVKRHWFRTQVRRLRQHASRRHGSLRLNIRRQFVFEDAYHQLRLRNADEMRGRIHVTFSNEEGVDAGGLSREFFAILAKEMFNPNYALFTSTEDGCTFQPNQHSSINPDHLSYFRFVGRIVGKAVSDGFLLDAHFTRSLYKHMLGMKPTYQDMEAIDPDYYKNLKMILEFNLEDIGLDLTFSTEAHSFGRSQTIDLIPNGRHVKVTEESKEKYVSLVCQHRMTTAIEKQIEAYLDGFYELVKPDLISIFTAKELELLISGMPDIDILDLKTNTDYQGYRVSDKEIGWFWNIMFSLSKSEKAAFLQFTTGSSKVPLNGFVELQGMRGVQKFSIHKVGGGAEGALMSAHTCFNSLDLPVYKSEEIMKEKLLLAIKEGGGAFLFS